MPTAASRSVNQKLDYIIPFVLALLVTGFLFFIDEGYYDMRWADDPGNWFVFFVYSGIMLGGQLLIRQFLFKKYTGWRLHAVVAFVGIPLGVLTAFGFFLVWMAI